MRIYLASIVAALMLLTLLAGCSSNPTVPNNPGSAPEADSAENPTSSQHRSLGYYLLAIDTENYEIEAAPLRSANLHLNVTGILNGTMGIGAAGVPGEHDPPNGIFTFDITLTHPFPSKTSLTGFDVKGILFAPFSWDIHGLNFRSHLLLNEDGYTRWWNPVEFTEPGLFGYVQGNLANATLLMLDGNVYPYKYFADILDATTDQHQLYSVPLDDDQGRGVFSAGAANTRRYRIQFPLDPEPEIYYAYAVDASWAPPSVKPPSEIPDDFPIEANQPEPYIVDLEVVANSLYYDWESGQSGGVLRLRTTVCDWQGQLNGDTLSEVSSMKVYIPTYYPGGIDFDTATNIGDTAVYELDLTGDIDLMYPEDLLVVVEAVTSSGDTYDQGLGHPAPTDVIAAWDATSVEVVDPPCETDSNNDFYTAENLGLNDSVVGYLCAGTDYGDYYKIHIPYGQEITGGTIYANSGIPAFGLSLYDQYYNQHVTLHVGPDPVIDLDTLDLLSGTYYIVVSVPDPGGEAATYFLETDITTQPLPMLDPMDITTGYLDLEADWVRINGDYAYLAGNTGVWVYDISDPGNPTPVFRAYVEVKAEPAFFYPHMYFLSGDSPLALCYIDFSDPTQPVNHGELYTIADTYTMMTMSDAHLFIYDSNLGDVVVFNYSSNPAIPSAVDVFHAFFGARKIGCVCPAGTYTSVLMMSNDVFVMYNVENLSSVEQKGFELLTDAVNRDFDIYLDTVTKVHSTPITNVLRTYNLDFDETLIYRGYVDLPEEPGCVAATWPNVYVAGSESENIITVYVFDPENPSIKNTLDISARIAAMDALATDLFAVSRYSGLRGFDLPGSGIPTPVSTTQCLNNPVLGIVHDDVGYFYDHSDEFRSLKTVDLADPASPVLVNMWGYDYDIHDIDVTSQCVYVTVGGNFFLDAYSIVSPGVLSYIKTIALFNEPLSAVIKNSRMYVGFASGDEMKVYGAGSPSTFFEIGTGTAQSPVEYLIAGSSALYGIRGDQVTVYDISDPYNPVEQPSYDATGYDLKSLAFHEGYLYVSTATDLLTLDLSDPLNPALANTLTITNPPDIQYMALDQQWLFSCSSAAHPYVTSVWDPGSPGGCSTPFMPDPIASIMGIITHDGYLFEMTGGSGVRVWELYP